MIGGRSGLQEAYRSDDVAREYVARRFTAPIGALLHARQAGVLRRVIRQNGLRRAVELAPGPARLTGEVAPLVDHVTVVDASAQMLAEARRSLAASGRRERVRFVQGDAFQLPLGEQTELVYTFRLIRHFELRDRMRIYGQAAALLPRGGWFVFDAVNEVVSAPMRASAASGEYQHYDALLTPAALRSELAEAGFEVASLVGVQHRYGTLMKCQIYLAPRSARLARAAMEIVDRLGGEPLEWVVVCRRK